RHRMCTRDTDSAVDIIVPVSFNFPSLGKLLVLLFVLFAAWFTDVDIAAGDGMALAFNGLFSLFGSINVAVPYLLETLQVPADMFQLFLVTGIVVGRFGAMLAALHIVVLSVLGALALSGAVHVRAAPVLRFFMVTVALLLVLVMSLRAYFSVFVPDPPPREEVLRSIHLMDERVPARVFTEVPATIPEALPGSRVDHILASGTLTVGYRPKNLPCSYISPDGDLVGFDVEMAHVLAQDMGVELEFVPFEFDSLGAMLSSGQLDIAMSCIALLPDRNVYASFSDPYLDLNMALIVKDHEGRFFSDIESMRELEDLTIAMVSTHYYERLLTDRLPDTKFVY
ncbi:MAG: substrate-binding periplasmic protein, partial [Halioglobus sp.]